MRRTARTRWRKRLAPSPFFHPGGPSSTVCGAKCKSAKEEEPGEEQHSNSIIGKEFIWNSNAVVFSPIFEDSNAAEPGQCKADVDMLHSGSAHRGTATVCDYYIHTGLKALVCGHKFQQSVDGKRSYSS